LATFPEDDGCGSISKVTASSSIRFWSGTVGSASTVAGEINSRSITLFGGVNQDRIAKRTSSSFAAAAMARSTVFSNRRMSLGESLAGGGGKLLSGLDSEKV
jgi:hypothetical protein